MPLHRSFLIALLSNSVKCILWEEFHIDGAYCINQNFNLGFSHYGCDGAFSDVTIQWGAGGGAWNDLTFALNTFESQPLLYNSETPFFNHFPPKTDGCHIFVWYCSSDLFLVADDVYITSNNQSYRRQGFQQVAAVRNFLEARLESTQVDVKQLGYSSGVTAALVNAVLFDTLPWVKEQLLVLDPYPAIDAKYPPQFVASLVDAPWLVDVDNTTNLGLLQKLCYLTKTYSLGWASSHDSFSTLYFELFKVPPALTSESSWSQAIEKGFGLVSSWEDCNALSFLFINDSETHVLTQTETPGVFGNYTCFFSFVDAWLQTPYTIRSTSDEASLSADDCVLLQQKEAHATARNDPHFQFADGGRADIRGQSGGIYNLLSHGRISLNVEIQAETFFFPRRTVHGTAIVAAFWRLLTTNMTTVIVEFEVSNFTGKPSGVARLMKTPGKRINLSNSVKVLFDNIVVSRAEDMVQVRTPSWDTSACASSFPYANLNGQKKLINVRIVPIANMEANSVAPHGLIGQSYDGDKVSVDGAMDTPQAALTTAQGEGAIEGEIQDYKMESCFATDFKFTRFGMEAAMPRNVSALSGVKTSSSYLWRAQ